MPPPTLPMKVMQRYWRLRRGVTLGVQCCVIDPDARILLVRHGYRPGWYFPGGGVEKSETILQAITREIEEETGIRPAEPPELFGVYANFRAFPNDHVAFFVSRSFERVFEPKPGFEIAETGFFPRHALPDTTAASVHARLAELFDAKTQSSTW